jgi:hypothetical protein
VANEEFGLAALLALASAWLIVKRLSPVPPEAWLLAFVLVGYIVGNRGFAQAQPTPTLPLLPAEAALLVGVPALAFRCVFRESPGWRGGALNYGILAWMLLGTLRLPLDLRAYGVVALRDYAMIYYAAFFFIAQDYAAGSPAAQLLRRALTLAFGLLVPVVVSILISPEFLVTHLTWHAIPLIYHKSDLIATSLGAGFFWLWTRWHRSGHRRWMALAAASLLLIAAMASPRAGMFAVFVTTILWAAAGRWRIAAAQAGLLAAAGVVALAAALFSHEDFHTSLPYSMYEHVLSFFDPAGRGTYVNNVTGDLGGNNQFRLIWWRDVLEDTLATHPALGQGFGADLSARFLVDFDLLNDEAFAARSPHSMVMTVIGRMGLLGLAAWLTLSIGAARLIWRLLRTGDPDRMGLASVAGVIGVSACFGVVLEGPMGAVAFWTVLGLASAQARELVPSGPVSPRTRYSATASAEWHVAKGS